MADSASVILGLGGLVCRHEWANADELFAESVGVGLPLGRGTRGGGVNRL